MQGAAGHGPGQFLITCMGFLWVACMTPMLTSLWLLKLTIAARLIYQGSINTSSAPWNYPSPEGAAWQTGLRRVL